VCSGSWLLLWFLVVVGGFVVLCTSQNYTSAWFIFSSVAGGFVISTSYENQQPVSKSFELSQDAGCLDNIGTTALRITRPLNCTTNLGKMDQVINTRTSKLRCILDWWLQLSHSPVIFFIDNALKIPKFVLLSHVFLHIHNQALDGGEISRICHFSHCGCLVTHCPL